MKPYGQYCPIAKAGEVLGARWSLLVLRELLIGSTKFNDIARGVPEMSRSLLTKRLREFETLGLLDRVDGQYVLTPAGEDLRPLVFGMGDWSAKWLLADPHDQELDPEKLLWWGHARIDTTPLPLRRIVLEFDFSDDSRGYWLVAEPEAGVSLCWSPPGFPVDVVVNTSVRALTDIWYGRTSIRDAMRAEAIDFAGPRGIVRHMPAVLTVRPASEMGSTPDAPRPSVYQPGRP